MLGKDAQSCVKFIYLIKIWSFFIIDYKKLRCHGPLKGHVATSKDYWFSI
jgi:hypothetical protein